MSAFQLLGCSSVREIEVTGTDIARRHHDLSGAVAELGGVVAGDAEELDLQHPGVRPLPVGAEPDIAHHGRKGRAARVVAETGVVDASGRFDGLGDDLHLRVGRRRHVVAQDVDAGTVGTSKTFAPFASPTTLFTIAAGSWLFRLANWKG
jgi:hypothetical protein